MEVSTADEDREDQITGSWIKNYRHGVGDCVAFLWLLSIVQIPFVASRHVTTRTPRRACSNMADDEEAVVLACKTISCFIIMHYFSSQMNEISQHT